MENPPAQKMDVQVKYRLVGPCPVVDDCAEALGSDLPLSSQLGGDGEEMAHKRFVFRLGFSERRQMFSGNNEEMNGRLWVQVLKRHH